MRLLPFLFIVSLTLSCSSNQNGIQNLIGRKITEKEAIRTVALIFEQPKTTPIKEILKMAVSITDRDIDVKSLDKILGREISGKEAIDAINRYTIDPDNLNYCCLANTCRCYDLGDCIALWFSANCANIPWAFDIQNGQCSNDDPCNDESNCSSCTNDDCNCPPL